MIKVVLSQYTKKNSLYIYKEIEKNLKKNEKSFLIVPDQYTLQSDIDFIGHIGYETVIDAKVLSFNSLLRFIIQKLGEESKKTLSQTGKVILLTKILRDTNEDLNLFKNSYTNIDFIENLSKLIGNIKEYNFDDEFFEKIFINENLDLIIKEKFKEIKIIYDNYQKSLEKTYLDSEDKMTFVIEKIKECKFLEKANFYFDKFDSFSDLRLEFLNELIKISPNITISINLPYEYYLNNAAKDLSIYDEALDFIRKLKDLSPIKIINQDERENTDISIIIKNFQSYMPKTYKEIPKNIRILENISTKTEVENIGLIIKKYIYQSKGEIRYRDFSIVHTSEDEYENELIKTFDRLGIAYFLDKRKKLSENHIIKTYMALIRLGIYKFKKEDLLFFVRSKIFDFGENANEKVIDFQNYIEKRNIKYSMIFEDKYFSIDENFYKNNKQKLESVKKELENTNYIRNILLDKTKRLYEFSKKNNPANEICKEIYRILSSENFISGINSYQEILKNLGKLNVYEENRQVWDKFIEILEQMNALLGQREISLKEFYTLLESAVKNTGLAIIPPSKDQVEITEFSRDRVSNGKYKIFLGLNDLYFPTNKKQEFLIDSTEKEKLDKENIDLKIYKRKSEDRQELNFLRMLSTSKKVFLSYALTNKANEPLNISSSLLQIKTIFPNIKITSMVDLSFDQIKFSKDLADKYFYQVLWKIMKNEKVSEEDKNISKAFSKFVRDRGDYEILLKGIFYNNDKEKLDEKVAKKLYQKNSWSVSELECYGRCPYKHFMSYGIRAKDTESYDVNDFEVGTIIHANMEYLSKELLNYDLDKISNKDLDKLINKNFEKILDENLDTTRKNYSKNKFILNNIHDNTRKNAGIIVEQIRNGSFKMEDFEVKFGPGEKFPAVFLDDKNYIQGRIDRIDSYKDYLRIIDYKSGYKEIKIYNIINGFDLQLVVYMLSSKTKNKKPVASFYLPLKDEIEAIKSSYSKELIYEIYRDKFKMNGLIIKVNEEILKLLDNNYDNKKSNIYKIQRANENIFSEKENEILEKYVKKLLGKYISDIKDGKIYLRPLKTSKDNKECDNCLYKGICKFDYTIDQKRYREIDKKIKIKDIAEEVKDD